MDQLENSNPYLLAKDTTSYYADCVEWCPVKHLSYFVCGTYQLDEEKSSGNDNQIRRGNVALYRLSAPERDSESTFNMLVEDCISTSGVLDMKWNPSLLHDRIILALACSDGKVLFKYMREDEKRIHFSHLTDCNLAENEEKMMLSIDWSCENNNSASIITSDTKGLLNYIQVREAEASLVSNWKAHDFESWVAAFNYLDTNIVYSGGDDCCFKAWDIRSLSTPPVFLKKNHSMGVTAISKSKLNENFLVTGSYDENIFLWDVRHMKSPLSEVHVGGGIWRLKWHPTNAQYLLSAAMHNGFHVLSIKNGELKLDFSYTGHKSLAYGVDWSYLTTGLPNSDKDDRLLSNLEKCNIKNIIASCSFYDNLLHVWGINF